MRNDGTYCGCSSLTKLLCSITALKRCTTTKILWNETTRRSSVNIRLPRSLKKDARLRSVGPEFQPLLGRTCAERRQYRDSILLFTHLRSVRVIRITISDHNDNVEYVSTVTSLWSQNRRTNIGKRCRSVSATLWVSESRYGSLHWSDGVVAAQVKTASD